MGPYLKVILQKQFEIAGHTDKFDSTDFMGDKWFHDLTWTTDQEMEFKRWVVDYLQAHTQARKEVLTTPALKTKKYLCEWFIWWNLSYGFRVINND